MNEDTRQGNRVHLDRRELLRRAAGAAGVGLGISTLAGGPAAAAQADRVEITVATDWTSGARGAILEQAVPEFERQFPQYRLTIEPIGGDYFDRLSVQLAGGTAADVMLFAGPFFLNFQELGAFADITPYVETLGVDMTEYTVLPNVFQAGGRQYGMPFQLTVDTWYANVNMFEETGVDLPREGWTWEEMLAAAQQLTNADQQQYGIEILNKEAWWAPFILSAGGNYMNPELTKTAFADGDGFEGFKFAVELITVHHVAPTPAQAAALATSGADTAGGNLFASGRVAMAPGNSGSVGSFQDLVGDRFRWQPIPQPVYPPTGGLRMIYSDQPHVVNAEATDPEAATQFAVFMAGEFVQGLIAEGRGSTPVLRQLQHSEQYLAPPPPNMEQIASNLEVAEPRQFTRNWLEWRRVIESEADLAFIGEISPEEAFANMIAAGDEVLAQG